MQSGAFHARIEHLFTTLAHVSVTASNVTSSASTLYALLRGIVHQLPLFP